MKRIVLSLIFVLALSAMNGQVTLEKTYNYSASVVKLETAGYKYYLMDVPNKQCRIYNMDHSIFKTINCAVPSGYFLSDIKFVSEGLFDSDSGIEIAYTYYKYTPTSTSYYYSYGSRIINEDGSNVITPIDGAQYIYVNKTGESQYKLFAYCFDYSVFPETVQTKIYSLPGVMLSGYSMDAQQPYEILNAYPNPASENIRVEYKLPENIGSANLYILDASGRTIKQFMVDGHSDHLSLSVSDMASGIYHYFIEYDNQRSQSKKMIVR